jgi:hypothetical protein
MKKPREKETRKRRQQLSSRGCRHKLNKRLRRDA